MAQSRPTTIPRRDPQTGQFVSGDEYDDIEVVSFRGGAGVTAANMNGGTGFDGQTNSFEGLQLVDYDEIVDRNEDLQLLYAAHALSVYQNSTATEDGTVAGGVEVSASPSADAGFLTVVQNSIDDGAVVGGSDETDSIDVIGRPLLGVAGAPFSDTASGIGGGGSAGEDRIEMEMFPGEMGQFHPRDELFLNGQFKTWNIDDAGVHLEVKGYHVYGVRSD